MLLANQPGGHHGAGGEGDGPPEDGLRHEDALGMVAQRPVTEIGGDLLGFVEPVMDVGARWPTRIRITVQSAAGSKIIKPWAAPWGMLLTT